MCLQSANSSHCYCNSKLQSARYQKHQNIKSLTLFACFHPVKPKTEKKKILKSNNLWQLSTYNFELFCHNRNTACPIFTLHGSQHTLTPPLSALCLRWIAYLHGHMTPRGKGARLCASLTRSAAALTLPLFSLRDSGVPGKLLLSRLPCPSVGRTGRLCLGKNTEY